MSRRALTCPIPLLLTVALTLGACSDSDAADDGGDEPVEPYDEFPGLSAEVEAIGEAVTRLRHGLGHVGPVGSNNWAIDGRHTESGRPIIANDPHQPLQSPSMMYALHLNSMDHGSGCSTGPGSTRPTIHSTTASSSRPGTGPSGSTTSSSGSRPRAASTSTT